MKTTYYILTTCSILSIIIGCLISCGTAPKKHPLTSISNKNVSLFYITNRSIKNSGSDPYKFYGYKSSKKPRYGTLQISHFPNKKKNTSELTALKELNLRNGEQFWEKINIALNNKETEFGERKMFLYVHGYNTTFAEAAFTGAKLDRTFQNDAVGCVFSWPSKGNRKSLSQLALGYGHDQDRVGIAGSKLANFLLQLKEKQPKVKLVVIAHSLGNKVLSQALTEFSRSPQSHKFISSIAFFAADVSRDDFVNDYAPIITKVSKKRSIYISKSDLALKASKKFNSASRLGDGNNPVTLAGYDTIDVTRVDDNILGHGYIRNNHLVSHDLFYNLSHEIPVSRRYGLRKVKNASGSVFWELFKND